MVGKLKRYKGKGNYQKKDQSAEIGYLSDSQALGDGLFEIRIFFSPGYRIYFGQPKDNTIILLWAGKKDTQKRDIEKA